MSMPNLQVSGHDASTACHCRCSPKVKGRNLVLTVDGTSNQFGVNNTNVVELYSRLAATEEQLNYYNSGIGTFAEPSTKWKWLKQKADNTVDLLIAWNFENVIRGAYRWLSERYKPGDRIYLFGFSRGAYQMRVLAGMIEKVGLIQEGNEEQIPFAFELYKAKGNDVAAARFKETFSMQNVRVHFLGVWDTVSSVGLVGNKTLPLTDKWKHINIFRHALALDERRVKFLPECIMGRQSQGPIDDLYSQDSDEGNVPIKRVKEVWFAGSHSDVGGGSLPNDQLNLESASLLWMVNEAAIAGILLKQSTVEWKIRDLEKRQPQKSLHSLWWLLEYFPVHRQSRSNPDKTSQSLHRGKGRAIYDGQAIHASVAFKHKDYKPEAVFRRTTNRLKWEDLIAQGPTGSFRTADPNGVELELDLFDLGAAPVAITLLSRGRTLSESNTLHLLNRLGFLASLDDGPKHILDSKDVKPTLIELLQRKGLVFLATVNLLARLAASKEAGLVGTGLTVPHESNSVATTKDQALAGSTSTSDINNDTAQNEPGVSVPPTSDSGTCVLDTSGSWTKQAIITPEIVQRIVEMLNVAVNEDKHDGPAASTIVELTHISEARLELHTCNAIKALVTMIRGDNANPAANALGALAQHDDARKMIFEAFGDKAHQTLNQMLETGKHCGPVANVIANLAESLFGAEKSLAPMTADQSQCNRDTVRLLVKMLPGVESGAAANAIAQLSRYAQLRKLILDHDDSITNLVKMLKGEEDNSAANALAALVLSEPENVHNVRDLILGRPRTSSATQTILLLVGMLDETYPGSAAIVLSELASDHVAAHTILESKAPSALMESINQHDARDIGQTARCIAAILRAYLVIPLGAYNAQKPTPEFSMPAIKTTGVSNLVEMLQDNNRCSAAADAIAALAEYGPDQRTLILANPNVIGNLTNMLKGNHFASAAMSFVKLAADEKIHKNLSDVAPMIIKRLTGLWQPSDMAADPATNEIIPEKAEEDDEPTQVPEFQERRLEIKNFDKGAGAVAVLATYDEFRRQLFDLPNLLRALINNLGAQAQTGTWNAIKALAGHKDFWQAVKDSDVLPVLVFLSRRGDRRQRIYADKCLRELADLEIGPRGKKYRGRGVITFCRNLTGMGR